MKKFYFGNLMHLKIEIFSLQRVKDPLKSLKISFAIFFLLNFEH
mgnify:CR=1 FL=1